MNDNNTPPAFIARWQGVGGSERANYQLFVTELLSAQARPLSLAEIQARFSARGRWRERLPMILDTLAALGRARCLVGTPQRWQAA